jgi:hypothetical protein
MSIDDREWVYMFVKDDVRYKNNLDQAAVSALRLRPLPVGKKVKCLMFLVFLDQSMPIGYWAFHMIQ